MDPCREADDGGRGINHQGAAISRRLVVSQGKVGWLLKPRFRHRALASVTTKDFQTASRERNSRLERHDGN
jgi:hypothetical protein